MYSRLIATGGYLPGEPVSNARLAAAKSLDTSDEWIVARTGIKFRHIAEAEETSVSMAYQAALQAIGNADIAVEDIDLIINATCTPSGVMPSDACNLANMLGANPGVIAFDVNAACSGFVYAMVLANNFIKANMVKCALIIGADKMTSLLDWSDRTTCVLFGDGAGAAIFKADSYPGIMSVTLGADGSKTDLLNTGFDRSNPILKMYGREVFKSAVKTLDSLVAEVLTPVGLEFQDVNWLVPHQANIRIIQCTAKMLGLSFDKVVQTVSQHANTSAASIPLALNSLLVGNKLRAGEHVLFEAFGAGFTWGATVLRY